MCRCGFLGLLHMDVFHQRLEQVFFRSFAIFYLDSDILGLIIYKPILD